MEQMTESAVWVSARLTVAQHEVREDAPGSGRCRQCREGGKCDQRAWAEGVLNGVWVPYSEGPTAPVEMTQA